MASAASPAPRPPERAPATPERAPRPPERTLGPDGPAVSRMGLGLAALGRPAYITGGRAADLPDRSVAGLRARDPVRRRRPLVRQGGGVPGRLAGRARPSRPGRRLEMGLPLYRGLA